MDLQLARNNLLNAVRLVANKLPSYLYMLKYSLGQDLDSIQSEYNTGLYSAMEDYFTAEDRPITSFRNEFRREVNDAFNMAVVAGWADGGGSGPIPDELQGWVNDRIDQEIEYVDELFAAMRDMRNSDPPPDPDAIANFIQGRADGYTNALVGIYAHGEMYAQTERPGKWEYGDTDHCDTCAGLNGQTHPLSWYLDNNYIPQEAGSSTLDCGGYYCQCTIVDPKTGEQLIP